MSIKEKDKSPYEDKEFEIQLFHALKYYGYLFPDDLNGIERFEKLYGKTEIEIPKRLQALDPYNSEDETSFDSGFIFKMAAFSATEHNLFESPEDNDESQTEEDNKDGLE